MMVYQTVRVLCHKALEKYNGKLPRPVNFILDEYRSLSLPADISGFISVLRSRNIAMSVILQAKSQLAELYDEATADSIVAAAIPCCIWRRQANKGTTSTCEVHLRFLRTADRLPGELLPEPRRTGQLVEERPDRRPRPHRPRRGGKAPQDGMRRAHQRRQPHRR